MASTRQKRKFLVAGIFVALAVGFWVLERQGISFGKISEDKILSHYLTIVFIILACYQVAVILTGVFVRLRKGVEGEVKMLSGLLRALTVAAFAVTFISALGKLTAISAVVAGFAGLLLGWSLQAPVSGIAAWVLITLKRPFRIGDRILLPSLGMTGDVKNVGIMYTVLNQVGGAVGSEEAVGRDILIPNAMLFSQVVVNYTAQQEAAYILDEVIVRITFDTDWELAEKILLNAAREVTGDAIPFVYSYRKGVQASWRPPYAGSEQTIVGVDIDSIEGLDAEPLSESEEVQIRDLARRIDQMGLLQPVIVERGGDNRYVILAGHQRLRACRLLGWRSIPAIVRG